MSTVPPAPPTGAEGAPRRARRSSFTRPWVPGWQVAIARVLGALHRPLGLFEASR
jgi:hypothetical protein